MRKKFRFLTALAVCVMVLSCFSVTAFAYADDTEQNLPVTEATQPEQQPAVTPTPEKPKGEPIDDEKTELENLEIINTVRSMVMDKDQIMAFLSSMKGGTKPAENTEVIDNA